MGDNELDMRMDKSQSLTAKIVVNNYSEEQLAEIIYKYGEERFSRSIARNICLQRKLKPIGNYLNSKIKINQKMNSSNKQMIRSSSLPKYDMLKFKLKPINDKTA